MTSASFTPSAGSNGFSQSFSYDGSGNPTSFKGAAHTFNNANQDTANTYNGNGDATTYHTLNGSGTAETMALTFNADDELTGVGSVMSAGYTAEGLRAWKLNSTTTTTTYFLYDGITPTVEMSATGSVTAVNTFGPDGLEARTTVSGTSSSTVFYTFDQQGSVAERLDSFGDVLSAHTFDAYGVSNATDYSNGSFPLDPYCGINGACGYYADVETGLQMLGLRYYDPASGRFITNEAVPQTDEI